MESSKETLSSQSSSGKFSSGDGSSDRKSKELLAETSQSGKRMVQQQQQESKKLRIVVKIGTSSLLETNPMDGKVKLQLVNLASVVDCATQLLNNGHEVVLVSSGAVGAGCLKMGLKKRPKDSLIVKQALASIGQIHLMEKYSSLFSALGIVCSQILLTYHNFVHRSQYMNARNTFDELLENGVVPIINENDVVGIQELRADNDKLASMVANMVGADLIFFLTETDGVFTANPNEHKDAERIPVVYDLEELQSRCKLGTGEDSDWGTGGMAAKISAACLCSSLGVRAVIMRAIDCAKIPQFVSDQLKGDSDKSKYSLGTTFERTSSPPPKERKRWIRSLKNRGTIVVDDGARDALHRRKTLFASGVISVTGNFTSLESIQVNDTRGDEIAVGLCNFSSEQLRQILKKRSEDVYKLFGVSGEVISRANMDYHVEKIQEVHSSKPRNKERGASFEPSSDSEG